MIYCEMACTTTESKHRSKTKLCKQILHKYNFKDVLMCPLLLLNQYDFLSIGLLVGCKRSLNKDLILH